MSDSLIEKLLELDKGMDKNQDLILPFSLISKIIGKRDIKILEKDGVLIRVSDTDRIWCESCGGSEGEPMTIRAAKSNGKYYYTCGRTGQRVRIKAAMLRKWKIHPKYRKQFKRLIGKDAQGNFYYNGDLIKMSKQTLYYKTLDILYEKGDQEGFVSYEKIESEFVKKGEKPIENRNLLVARITRARSETQGLFHLARINHNPFINKTLDGRKLIEVRRGKGLILNNSML